MAQLHNEMGAIRQHEKDMIIGYEQPEAVKAAHAKWLASLDKAKLIAAKFLQGEDDADNPVVRNIVAKLDAYREQFAHVARQLEASGYDTATIANRMNETGILLPTSRYKSVTHLPSCTPKKKMPWGKTTRKLNLDRRRGGDRD